MCFVEIHIAALFYAPVTRVRPGKKTRSGPAAFAVTYHFATSFLGIGNLLSDDALIRRLPRSSINLAHVV